MFHFYSNIFSYLFSFPRRITHTVRYFVKIVSSNLKKKKQFIFQISIFGAENVYERVKALLATAAIAITRDFYFKCTKLHSDESLSMSIAAIATKASFLFT